MSKNSLLPCTFVRVCFSKAKKKNKEIEFQCPTNTNKESKPPTKFSTIIKTTKFFEILKTIKLTLIYTGIGRFEKFSVKQRRNFFARKNLNQITEEIGCFVKCLTKRRCFFAVL